MLRSQAAKLDNGVVEELKAHDEFRRADIADVWVLASLDEARNSP